MASATLALINPVAQLAKSRDSRRQSDIKQIQSALELYRSDQGEYPPPNGNSVEQPLVSPDGVTTYIQSVPTDPKGQDYYYRTLSTNSQYEIYACAEKDTTSSETTALAGVNSRFNCTRYFVGRNP